jgi:hypothetical protein
MQWCSELLLIWDKPWEGRKMGNGQQSGSSGRIDWPFRLAGAVGAAVGGGLALLVMSLADLHLFPLGLIVFWPQSRLGSSSGDSPVLSCSEGRPTGELSGYPVALLAS